MAAGLLLVVAAMASVAREVVAAAVASVPWPRWSSDTEEANTAVWPKVTPDQVYAAKGAGAIEQLFLQLNLQNCADARVLLLSPPLIQAICGYDPSRAEGSKSLQLLRLVQQTTHCLFAKRAQLWGARSGWDEGISCLAPHPESGHDPPALRESLAAFALFAAHLHRLDGFAFAIQHPESATPVSLNHNARAVCWLLSLLRFDCAGQPPPTFPATV
jgi:hypothetical protein